MGAADSVANIAARPSLSTARSPPIVARALHRHITCTPEVNREARTMSTLHLTSISSILTSTSELFVFNISRNNFNLKTFLIHRGQYYMTITDVKSKQSKNLLT